MSKHYNKTKGPVFSPFYLWMNALFLALRLSASFLRCESQSTSTERLRRWLGVSGASLCSYTFESDALFRGVPQGAVMGPTLLAFRFAPLVCLTNKCRHVLYYCHAYRCYMLIISRFRWIINTFVCLSAIDILCRWDCSLVFASVRIIFKAARRSHSSLTQSQKSQRCIMKSSTHCVSFASQPEQKKIIHTFL